MALIRKIKYQFRLFIISVVSLWSILGIFALLQYRNIVQWRRESLAGRVTLCVDNILSARDDNYYMSPYMKYFESYFEDSPLENLCMSIYDTRNGSMLYSRGPLVKDPPEGTKLTEPKIKSESAHVTQAYDVPLPQGGKAFLFCKGRSLDGAIEISAYLPDSPDLVKELEVGLTFWLILIFVGIAGTMLIWVIIAHQAKNIMLLRDFANRAANDRQFIPITDFPADEIGDISRQIVTIYNDRIQANLRREREHAIALKAVSDKNDLKRMMTNNISHELKTPIGIIRSYLEMIQSNPDMSPEERKYFIGKAQDNVERLVSMMNDLSTMTRLEESNDKIPVSDIDFHDLVFSFAEDITANNMIKDFEFSYDIPLDCHVYGNGDLLLSALSNLTKNAVLYSQGSRIELSLIGRNDKFYTFSFRDNGKGVAPEHLTHLFERFYRIDWGRSRKAGGTGLGLPIVKSAFVTMGGSVSVRNHKDGGLQFIFTLRRIQPNHKEETAEEENANDNDSGTPTPAPEDSNSIPTPTPEDNTGASTSQTDGQAMS